MKKRKISVEKNSEYRKTSAHSGVANLNLRRSRSAKSPSVQNLHNLDLSEEIAKPENNRTMLPDEMQPPKTRFTSRDRSKEKRSISSPRLKSFPAEKIKKLNNSPIFTPEPINALITQQDPRKTGTFFVNSSARSNNGHGDMMFAQLSPIHQQTKPQNTSSTSQQQIVANHQQTCQTNPHSETLLTRQVASSERHRPFVPNVFQGAVNQPTIINQPVIQPSLTQMPQQTSSDSHAVIDQNHNEATALDSKCKKQPISGRNATNHRQMFVQMQQQKQEAILRNAKALLNNRSANDYQNVYHPQLHYEFHPQNLQQIYQQSPRDAYHQQIPQHIYNNLGTCCNYYNRQLSAAQAPGQGMTSPQDVTVNQMRLMQHNLPIYQQNHGYPVNSPSAWPQNNGWMQATSRNQQHLHQQSLPQWQCYCYQTPTAQNINFNQQNSRNQGRSNLSPNQTNYKSTNQQSATAAYNQQDGGKKTLQFTPEMIRDQELLVSSMRQQGVPDQVMQRQFDALLNEQRRHLAYVAQFQQQTDTAEVKETQLVRRRAEKDEKPEWMVHITPPRISYDEIGRTETQVRTKEQCLTDDQSPEEMSRMMAAQEENYNQQTKTEMSSQIVSPQQMYLRMNPHPQIVSWMYRNNQVPYDYRYLYGHQQNAPTNAYYQPGLPFNDYIQYSYNMPYNHPYHSRAEQEIRTGKHNLNSSNSIDAVHFYQQNKSPTEPSSLLKMRVYKEMIRPQKRNNGLQDPHAIQKTLDALKDPTNRRSLQYLASLAKKKPVIKLNGTQDPDKIPEDMQPRPPVEITLQFRKGISANGLENTRNSNNPPPRILRPKRADEPMMLEYPRQKQNTRNCYSMQAEKENDTQQQNSHAVAHAQDAESILYDPQSASTAYRCNGNNAMIFQNTPSQDYHRMQQYYLNRQNSTGHNGGQGDVANMRRPDVSNANRIDRAGGDTGEKSGAEETTKHMNDAQATQGTNAYGQPEIREARTIGGITYLASKPDEYGVNNFVISPNKLIANRHLQPPKIF